MKIILKMRHGHAMDGWLFVASEIRSTFGENDQVYSISPERYRENLQDIAISLQTQRIPGKATDYASQTMGLGDN
jgi:hypothetical protein